MSKKVDQGHFPLASLGGQVNLPKENLIWPAKNGVSGKVVS